MHSLEELRRWADEAPEGTSLPARALVQLLDGLEDPQPEPEPTPVEPGSWRERLWRAPSETRLCVEEVAEAVGRSRHWVYRATSRESNPLPSRKLDGRIEVTAGELRAWIRDHEDVRAGGPYLRAERGAP